MTLPAVVNIQNLAFWNISLIAAFRIVWMLRLREVIIMPS